MLGLLLMCLALALLAVAAAAEAGVAAVSRVRLRAMAGRGGRRAELLHQYAEERASTLGSVAVARNLAVVLATAIGIFFITRQTGHTWGVFALVSAGVLAAIVVVDALPRLIVARSPERWGVRLVPAVRAFRVLFGPVAIAINRSLAAVVRTADEPREDETAELLRLAEIETDGEPIEEEERQMIRGIIEMEDTTAREIMVPRIDIEALDASETLDDALKLIVDKGFSRIPLYDDTIDNVVGVIYAKDLLRCVSEGRRPPLRDIARPPYFIPESKRVDELLAELRQSKVHIAVVVDEYGGTAGIVTIEDLLEEIVGEIQDEYDREEAPIERLNETEAILDGRVSIETLTELFGFEPDEQQDYDTVGGFVYHRLGKVPVAGDEVRVDGLTLRVLSVIGRRIKKVRARKVETAKDAVVP
ncbi:MAG TPA: hemolysin family protein [Dehalococcoidia bacterium]|nr:hemolysin family protein [Dehalococcoidia bacterium]